MQIILALQGIHYSAFEETKVPAPVVTETPKGTGKDIRKDLRAKVEEDKPREKFVKDLLTQPHLTNVLLNVIKDLKNETLHILVSQHTVALLDSFKVSLSEFAKLTEEQLVLVKESLFKHSGHQVIKEMIAG